MATIGGQTHLFELPTTQLLVTDIPERTLARPVDPNWVVGRSERKLSSALVKLLRDKVIAQQRSPEVGQVLEKDRGPVRKRIWLGCRARPIDNAGISTTLEFFREHRRNVPLDPCDVRES